MNLSEKLKLLRSTEGFTQKKLSKLVDCGYSTYQKYELGIHEPPHKVIAKICQKFPEYTLWLMTGKTSGDQIDPFIKQEKSDKTT
jgi:transcriptional regulator with XRE-family HTH domain